MILKKGGFAAFARHVKEAGKTILIYGAGVIGQTAAPYWLCAYQLDSAVLCYVDADSYKQGQTVSLAGRDVPVRSPAVLGECPEKCVILVTASAFEPIAQMLEQAGLPDDTEVYFLPVMLIDLAHTLKSGRVVKTGRLPLIPRKIHYCWFSGNPIPDNLRRCMDSWSRFCPDYEIIRWDESNYDVDRHPYTRQAYERKKWGFVTDVARWEILYSQGGIYLDTDVELLRNLDELLYQPGFCATEKWGVLNSGGGSGARAGNPAVRAILEFRKDIPLVREDGSVNQISSGYYDTLPLIAQGLRMDGTTQTVMNHEMTVYASEFFHPFDYISGETKITENTFSIHYFSGTWLNPDAAEERVRTRQRYENFVSQLEE